MSNYYSNESAKVALSSVLRENGWKIYGYKKDESDAMFDYWNPASWDGVATKNGFVLLVDQYSTRMSGYEVKKYNHSKTSSNSSKIAKLEAMVNDAATTQGEKENAQNLIEKLNSKDTTPSYEVLSTYPTFEFKTPKGCIWHIEKDGVIIAKGKGLYSLYESNDRELTNSNMKKFAEKLEKHINDDTELVAVEKQVKNKVIEFVETDSKELELNVSYIRLNVNFTGGFHKGSVVAYTKDWTTKKVFLRLGKKLQKLTDKSDNMLMLSNETLEKYIANGTISVGQLQEVEKVSTKTVYVKQKRKQKVAPIDVQLETTVEFEEVKTESNEEVISNSNETVQPQETNIVQNEIIFKLNEEKNGVEIYFTEKPSEQVLDKLKANGFRWSRFNKAWYAKQSEKTISFAENLAGKKEVESEQVEKFEYDVPEFADVTEFTINEETEKRLINNSLFGDMRKVGYETESLQGTLSSLLVETKQVIEMTDNTYYKKKLVQGFNSFCERYTRELSNYLYSKSVHVPWYISGRGNLNKNTYNKKVDAIDKKMLKVVEILEKQKAALNKYKNKIKSDAVYKTKQAIKEAVNNSDIEITFTTRKRELNYYGYTYNTRSYESMNYFFMNMAGCYRIFDNKTGKEIHSMKTTDKLTDAKAYVVYLESLLAV